MTPVVRDTTILILLGGGLFFFAVGVLGLVRLPDLFTRMHATTKSDTLGAGLALGALIVHYGFGDAALRVSLIILFVLITTPVAAHLIARAAYRAHHRTGNGNDDCTQ